MCRIAGFVFWGMGGAAEHIIIGGDLCFGMGNFFLKLCERYFIITITR